VLTPLLKGWSYDPKESRNPPGGSRRIVHPGLQQKVGLVNPHSRGSWGIVHAQAFPCIAGRD
ncbi:MAG TPA: hypothetical protein VG324_24400, partial [Blastocatellia bacterium]|nr:hypothetical protein [Blastocatellia bacterium]